MFNPDELKKIQQVVQNCAQRDRALLDQLRAEAKKLKPNVRKISRGARHRSLWSRATAATTNSASIPSMSSWFA